MGMKVGSVGPTISKFDLYSHPDNIYTFRLSFSKNNSNLYGPNEGHSRGGSKKKG